MTEATATSLAGMVGTWQLDPKHTTVEFHTTAMWGLAKVTGTVRPCRVVGSWVTTEESRGNSYWTQHPSTPRSKGASKHLRGSDFLDVGTYPTFTFTVSDATAPSHEGTVEIKGSLRIKDQSHPVELVATLTTPSVERITLHSELAVDRRQWGVSRAPMGAGLVNRVTVVAQFVRL